MDKKIGTIVIIILVAVFLYISYDYFSYRTKNAVSEAAFIKSDKLTNLTFKVDGKVIKMLKKENEEAKKGELLALIDQTDFNITKRRVEHELRGIEKDIEQMRIKKSRLEKELSLKVSIAKNEKESIGMKIDSLKYKIKALEDKLFKLEKDTNRYKSMLEKNLIAASEYEEIVMRRDSILNEIKSMQKELFGLEFAYKSAQDSLKIAKEGQKVIKEIKKSIEAAKNRLRAKKEVLQSVKNQISYTYLYAPFDGIIAKKYFDAPRVVKSGTPIYALTDPKRVYCEVLLSEKKMYGIKPGNKAVIAVDALKGRKIDAKVESIAPTSASTFSLVPRDIASGEFTKLDQRFIVRLSINDNDIEDLRAGMSATVAIERK